MFVLLQTKKSVLQIVLHSHDKIDFLSNMLFSRIVLKFFMSNFPFFFFRLDKGNPGDLPGLYSGSVAEYSKADTVIFRTDLFNLQTGEKVYPFKRTIKYDSKWLDSKLQLLCFFFLNIIYKTSFFYFVEPNFVGSFELGDYVYFFFRESAVEYINCGKAIYSRIARVCKRDTGGRNILNKNWATFMWVYLYKYHHSHYQHYYHHYHYQY